MTKALVYALICVIGLLVFAGRRPAPPAAVVNVNGCCHRGEGEVAAKPSAPPPATPPDVPPGKLRMCWPMPRPGTHPGQPLGDHVDALIDPLRAAMEPSKRWPNGSTITYALFGGSPPAQAEFRAAVADVSQYVNLKITEAPGDQAADLRVTFTQDGSSWSNVGTDCRLVQRGQATMNLGWPDDLARSKHELLHAVGLMHNQAIPNADLHLDAEKCYRYFGGPPNNWPRSTVDSQVLYIFRGSYVGSGFDRASIMQYAVAPELTTDGRGIPWNQALSTTDVRDLRSYYPGGMTPPAGPPVNPPINPPVNPPAKPPVSPPGEQTVAVLTDVPSAGVYPVGLTVGNVTVGQFRLTAGGAGRYRLTLAVEGEGASAAAPAHSGP